MNSAPEKKKKNLERVIDVSKNCSSLYCMPFGYMGST